MCMLGAPPADVVTPPCQHGVMDDQLRLMANPQPTPDWCLDDDTRETGRRGVALARQAMHEARHRCTNEQDASAA